MTDLIGTIAAILTTASFVPQAILVLRTRDTRSLSLLMYSMFTAGIICWLIYGAMIQSLPIIIANAITIVLASIILGMKIANVLKLSREGRARLL